MSNTAEKIAKAWTEEDADPEMRIIRDLACTNAILSLLQHGEPEGFVLIPKAALDWLYGAGPDHNGKEFGEVEDTVKPVAGKYYPRYWWRLHFRKICEAFSASPPAGETE